MIKQLAILIVLSIIIVLTLPVCHSVLLHTLHFQQTLLGWLGSNVFTQGSVATFIMHLLALLILPIGIGIIFAIVFFILKKPLPRYLPHVLWAIWLILATATILR